VAVPNTPTSNVGKGVDAFGGQVVDPTKNVLDLVNAESRFQNALRDAESKHARDVQALSDKYQDAMRASESRRQDDLAALRLMYDSKMSDVLTVQVKTTSDLISTQLDKVTSALGTQITTSVNSLLDRINQLERFRWEVGGKTSVQDPAMSQALTSMANAIATLQSGSAQGEGRHTGQGQIIAYIVAAVAVGGLIVELFRLHP
jgi:hypothetical protein